MHRTRHAITGLLIASGLAGCASSWAPSGQLVNTAADGQYAAARELVAARIGNARPSNRDYILAHAQLAMLELADGQAEAAEQPFLAAYDILRLGGVNKDSTVNVIFDSEQGGTTWKGEPFEQAMTYAYFAAQLASLNDWGNANAAAQQSLFQLADFAQGERPPADRDGDGTLSTVEIGLAAQDAPEDYLDNGYQPIETDFAPGYMMAGAANWARAHLDDSYRKAARDNFNKAIRNGPGLKPVVDALVSRRANTLLWIDFGKGPQKIRTGYADAYSEFRSSQPMAPAPLRLRAGGAQQSVEYAADLDRYARDHRWRQYEDVRVAKALVGDAAIVAGSVATATARSDEQAIAGIAAIIAGAIINSGAAADIRYNEVLPRFVYFAAVDITEPDTTIQLEIAGAPGTRLALPAIDPPTEPERLAFRYIRLNNTRVAPTWATSAAVRYANDHYDPTVPGDGLPYIMGGRCVRTPSENTLRRYQADGNLLNMTLVELRNLYAEEGITLDLSEQAGNAARHILEGGNSLVTPLAGTAGYTRLFCADHPAFAPRSQRLLDAIRTHRAAAPGPAPSSP